VEVCVPPNVLRCAVSSPDRPTKVYRHRNSMAEPFANKWPHCRERYKKRNVLRAFVGLCFSGVGGTVSLTRSKHLLLGCALSLMASIVLVDPAQAASPSVTSQGTTTTYTYTYTYTGASQTFTVPGGVTSLQISATGAAGGATSSAQRGLGATATAAATVTPGATFTVEVGGVGAPSSNGASPTGGGFNGGGGSPNGGAGGGGGL
jgi:hypothetical protein